MNRNLLFLLLTKIETINLITNLKPYPSSLSPSPQSISRRSHYHHWTATPSPTEQKQRLKKSTASRCPQSLLIESMTLLYRCFWAVILELELVLEWLLGFGLRDGDIMILSPLMIVRDHRRSLGGWICGRGGGWRLGKTFLVLASERRIVVTVYVCIYVSTYVLVEPSMSEPWGGERCWNLDGVDYEMPALGLRVARYP